MVNRAKEIRNYLRAGVHSPREIARRFAKDFDILVDPQYISNVKTRLRKQEMAGHFNKKIEIYEDLCSSFGLDNDDLHASHEEAAKARKKVRVTKRRAKAFKRLYQIFLNHAGEIAPLLGDMEIQVLQELDDIFREE